MAYLTSPLTWIAFMLGAIVGSFLNVCIYRIPEGNFWSHARSLCRYCQAPIPFYYNIPVCSYFLLRGKTACCKKSLSAQYPLVEFFTAVMFAFLYWQFPFVESYSGAFQVDHANLLRFAHASLFTCLMIVCSGIDLHHMIIPDVISLPMIAASPLIVFMHPELDWRSSLIGIVVGGGSLYLIAWLYWLARREVGMGFGDVKLLAAIGGWLGYQAIAPTVFLASIAGSFVGIGLMVIKRNFSLKSSIPFGPFLAAGALVHLLFGGSIEEWIFRVSG